MGAKNLMRRGRSVVEMNDYFTMRISRINCNNHGITDVCQ